MSQRDDGKGCCQRTSLRADVLGMQLRGLMRHVLTIAMHNTDHNRKHVPGSNSSTQPDAQTMLCIENVFSNHYNYVTPRQPHRLLQHTQCILHILNKGPCSTIPACLPTNHMVLLDECSNQVVVDNLVNDTWQRSQLYDKKPEKRSSTMVATPNYERDLAAERHCELGGVSAQPPPRSLPLGNGSTS